jgi:predicted NodU family carbamoyl transferase
MFMKIFSVALSPHDHNTFDGVLHKQIERYSRRKHNIPWHFDAYAHHSELLRMNQDDDSYSIKFYDEYFKPEDHEVLAFTTTIGGLKLIPHHNISKEFLDFKPQNLWDYKMIDNIYYIDHHQSHAAYARLTSGFEVTDTLAIDGRGWNYNCVFFDKDGNMTDLSDKMSLGILWNYFSKQVGFGHLGAGKLMGLAGYGEYQYEIHNLIDYYSNHNFSFPNKMKQVLDRHKPEDIAYTLQEATHELIETYVYPLKSCDNLCIAGGVAYNGYMNEEFTKHYKKVHVPPAPGDEGQSLGTYMHANKMLNNKVDVIGAYNGQEYEYVGEEKG